MGNRRRRFSAVTAAPALRPFCSGDAKRGVVGEAELRERRVLSEHHTIKGPQLESSVLWISPVVFLVDLSSGSDTPGFRARPSILAVPAISVSLSH
jgi:hypothetical protein